jgi:hypothetical protein
MRRLRNPAAGCDLDPAQEPSRVAEADKGPVDQPNRRLDIPIGEPDLLIGKALFDDGGYRS